MRPLVVVALLVALARPAAANSTADAVAHIDGRVSAFDGVAAVVIADPATGFQYARNDDVEFVSASLYKLGVMVEAYRQAAAGTISLDDTLTVEWSDVNADDGWYVDPGTQLTIREALEWTITWSDNSTAAALLRVLAVRAVNATFASLGMAHTRINWMLPEEERTADANITTARDMRTLLLDLLAGTVVDRAASAEMIALLERQQVNDRLPAGLPAGTVVAHKTGNLGDVAHDAGIIFTPSGPRIAVVLTAHYASYDDVIDLAASVASETYSLTTPVFASSIGVRAMPSDVRAGQEIAGLVDVTNRSSYPWSTARLTARWADRWGASALVAPPIALPFLEPEATTAVTLRYGAPSAGFYVLEMRVAEADAVGEALRLPVIVR